MTLICNYPTKKALKESTGKKLNYTETSFFQNEYKADGVLYASNRPQITGIRLPNGKRAKEFFARITMEKGLIKKVE